jgi:hypothetical protein
LRTYHLQDEFDFSESGQYYYSVIVPSVYKLSAYFLIRPMIKESMTGELRNAFLRGPNPPDASGCDQLISINTKQINHATDDMFNAYLLDCDLDSIYEPESDWFQEYLFTPEIKLNKTNF